MFRRKRAVAVGVVKFWRGEKGWGAISSPDLPEGRDAWAHFSAVDIAGYRTLVEGQKVEFTYRAARQESFDFVVEWIRPLP